MPKKPPATEMDRQAGLRLRAAREAWLPDGPIKQATFAAHMGVERTALANWEAGRLPDVRACVRLYLSLRVPIDWIFLGDPRQIEYGIIPRLQEACGRFGAVFGAPADTEDMALPPDPRVPGPNLGGSVPRLRRRHGTLHEP